MNRDYETRIRQDIYSGGVIGIFSSAILYVMALNGLPETLQTQREHVVIPSRGSREEIEGLVWGEIPYGDSKAHRQIVYRKMMESRAISGRGLRIKQP